MGAVVELDPILGSVGDRTRFAELLGLAADRLLGDGLTPVGERWVRTELAALRARITG